MNKGTQKARVNKKNKIHIAVNKEYMKSKSRLSGKTIIEEWRLTWKQSLKEIPANKLFNLQEQV